MNIFQGEWFEVFDRLALVDKEFLKIFAYLLYKVLPSGRFKYLTLS